MSDTNLSIFDKAIKWCLNNKIIVSFAIVGFLLIKAKDVIEAGETINKVITYKETELKGVGCRFIETKEKKDVILEVDLQNSKPNPCFVNNIVIIGEHRWGSDCYKSLEQNPWQEVILDCASIKKMTLIIILIQF